MLQLEKEFLLQSIAYDTHICDILLFADPVLWISELFLQGEPYCSVLKKLSAFNVSKELQIIWQDVGMYQQIRSITVQQSDVSSSMQNKRQKNPNQTTKNKKKTKHKQTNPQPNWNNNKTKLSPLPLPQLHLVTFISAYK